MNCRFCNKKLSNVFVSLGSTPLSNAYLKEEQLGEKEPVYPLEVYVCDSCFLVQLPEFENPANIFSDYAYFSSYSDTWLKHAKDYVDMMVDKFNVGRDSFVVEIASNDGYLLQYFMERDIPVLGIEPAANVAQKAREKGITTEVEFFGTSIGNRLAQQERQADILLGNNVLAHVPDLNDFVKGLKILLKPEGIITMEFPHLARLIDGVQFDTIYHEHFSYFSFITVEKVFGEHGLSIFDVEELLTHGGSLRIYACHVDDDSNPITHRVVDLKSWEEKTGYTDLNFYLTFTDKVKAVKQDVLSFLLKAKSENRTVVGYGAAAKGNTLLNYCGVKGDLIGYVADRSPYKQGHYLPGSHIPIQDPVRIKETKPDYLFILPWNIKDEIMEQMMFIQEWGGKFVTPIPEVRVI